MSQSPLTRSELERPLASCSRSLAAPQSSACTWASEEGKSKTSQRHINDQGSFLEDVPSPFLHQSDGGLAEQVIGQQVDLPHGVGEPHRQLLSQEHVGRFLARIFPA